MGVSRNQKLRIRARFPEEYIIDFNGAEAWRRAGGSALAQRPDLIVGERVGAGAQQLAGFGIEEQQRFGLDADAHQPATQDLGGEDLAAIGYDPVAQTVALEGIDGAGGQTGVHVQISYQYNGLGKVTRKTEATGDYTTYVYASEGRRTQEARSGFTAYAGATVTPYVNYTYDVNGNRAQTLEDRSQPLDLSTVSLKVTGAQPVLRAPVDRERFLCQRTCRGIGGCSPARRARGRAGRCSGYGRPSSEEPGERFIERERRRIGGLAERCRSYRRRVGVNRKDSEVSVPGRLSNAVATGDRLRLGRARARDRHERLVGLNHRWRQCSRSLS